MDITAAAIQKFFAGECAPDEAERVAAYLYQHPQVLNDLFSQEWADEEQLTEAEKEMMLAHIMQHTETLKPLRRMPSFKQVTAVAASLLLAVAAGYLLFFFKQNPMPPTAAADSKEMRPDWIMQSNVTAKTLAAHLQDGSTVQLQPAALIRYQSFGNQKRRDVYLSGEAVFEVAKDKNKPFTVYAGGIATTALGTRFNVVQKDKKVTVQLFEGKVKITAVTALKGWMQKALFLKPGQEFIYDAAASLCTVRNIHSAVKTMHTAPAAVPVTKEATVVTAGNWYMFNNQPLPHVFEQLEELYSVKINYNERDFRNVYFIGRFEKADSLEHILNNIALLKKLQIQHTGNRYTITRKKP